ncbi:TRAP transporter large permease subunit [Paucibacter sp. Y2R2-4]|uniref:TRAP transporter large permease subunit n=1 Tax=Paucibacter sp. Y2R2-4 TaxID=2893553 RepID=UPI0021E4C796|nr:TRAP transporter large permease subunit [Paucibacter sp. Y2R2-4]MCV2349603.1 TRAP transporter large permease subunit [Paucibacter sp. Y2R2-4]
MGAQNWRVWLRFDEGLSALALALMMLIPMVEIAMRPLLGQGVDNASVLVQHLGLVMAMFGALAAERHGHLTSLGASGAGQLDASQTTTPKQRWMLALSKGGSALICGALAQASWHFVRSEMQASQPLAYGLPVWWVQACMPLGFVLLGARLASRCAQAWTWRLLLAMLLPALGWAAAAAFDGRPVALMWPLALALLALLFGGAPIFAVLGGLALLLFWQDGLPLASVPLSHYQITVNPSLPALPLFTLAGLIFARTGAAQRLGDLFLALFGASVHGTVLAAAVLCSAFTAFTGGSGVTILALGGLLLPLLRNAGYPEQRGIGLVTSASALGVLLAPSVPLIMYAVIARVPIKDMFLAGLIPALVMVASLLFVGGFWRTKGSVPSASVRASFHWGHLGLCAWRAKWEVAAPVVAIGALVSGLATPTESAALTAAYALATQALAHRELTWRSLGRCLSGCAQIIGGVMLILGMALALTNFLVDAGIPDAAVEAAQQWIPNRYAFLLALCLFLFVAAALMEIYAALVVLVPLLLPVALSYGIEPLHFGIIFLAAMEVGFLCPPAGMNIYFASAMFSKSLRYVAASVLPALLAIFLGTLLIACVPWLSTGLPALLRH